MKNLRLALRLLRKSPGFTVLVVLTLALGIGANTAIFNLVATTCLRPLPYPDAGRLMHVAEKASGGENSISYPNFLDWHQSQDVFSALAIYRSESVKLKTEHGSEQITAMQVSRDFFAVLGFPIAMGRTLRPEDDRVGAAPVVWITHGAWQRHLGGAADIVGRTVILDGQATTVAGVLPPEFRFHRAADIYVPIEPFVDQQFMRTRENHNGTMAVARLKPGVTPQTAQSQLSAIAARLEREYPKANAGMGVLVVPLRERLQEKSTTVLYLLLGAVGMLLLIACVNVANMLLARALSRRREMAIRTALGAGRRDLIVQLLTESLLLAFLGGAFGMLLGKYGYDFVARLAPWQMRELMRGATDFNFTVWAFSAFLTMLTGVAFGLAPAWQLSHANPNDALKNTRPTVRGLIGRMHLADVLVVVQVSLAVILLVGAGLLIRSLQRVTSTPIGLQPDRVLTLKVATPATATLSRDPGAFIRYHETMLERVQALGEVESAAFVSSLPFTWNMSSNWFFRPDRPLPEPSRWPTASFHVVTPDYFRTLGIPLIRGAWFTGKEPRSPLRSGTPVTLDSIPKIYEGFVISAVISRKMADEFWPGEDPIGKMFQLGKPDMKFPQLQVIGIVGNTTQFGAERGETAEYYTLLTQWPATMSFHLAARTRQAPASAMSSLRAAIRSVAPDEPIYDIKVMAERVDGFASDRRFTMGLFSFFAVTALLLAAIGIYGVLACVVGQRTREIGIRMALGAHPGRVLRNVISRGLALVVPGVALGLIVAWAGSRVLQSQLFGVTANDAFAYLVSGSTLVLVAIAACLVPAQRASRVNPVEALRTE